MPDHVSPGIKINSKGIKSLIRAKTTKFLKENIDVNHHDVESGTGSSGNTPKVQATKENIDKLVFIKILNFCVSKDTIKKVKISNWGKHLQIIRDLYLEYIKNSYNSLMKRQLNFKMGKDLNRHLFLQGK